MVYGYRGRCQATKKSRLSLLPSRRDVRAAPPLVQVKRVVNPFLSPPFLQDHLPKTCTPSTLADAATLISHQREPRNAQPTNVQGIDQVGQHHHGREQSGPRRHHQPGTPRTNASTLIPLTNATSMAAPQPHQSHHHEVWALFGFYSRSHITKKPPPTSKGRTPTPTHVITTSTSPPRGRRRLGG